MRRRVLWGGAVIAMSALLVGTGVHHDFPSGIAWPDDSHASGPAFPQIGSRAQDFRLERLTLDADAETGEVRLSDFEGRYVYLDVFGTWCLPCQVKYSSSPEIIAELEAMDVVVLGLLYQDSPARARAWFRDNGGLHYDFAMLDERTAAEWGVTGAPMGYLISPDGRIETRCFGCDGRWSMDRLPDFVEDLRTRSQPDP